MADVGCAGIMVADTFCGPMKSLPVEGQLLALDSMPSKPGGCAPNAAIDLSKQGFTVDVAGCMNHDAAAEIVLKAMQQYQVNCDHVIYTDLYPTSTTVILLVEGQDRRYIHVFGANKAFTVEHIDRDWIKTLKVFYLGGLFAMPGIDNAQLIELLDFCKANNVISVVDVVLAHDFSGMDQLKQMLPHIDYFLPNDDESLQITGQSDPVDQLKMFKKLGAHNVVVTLGRDGAIAASEDKMWKIGIYPADRIDPSGSGDAFASGLITGILDDLSMPDAMRYGTALGGSATEAIGTTDGVFTRQQALDFMDANQVVVEEL